MDEFTPGEIEAVMANEIGHHEHRDLSRGLAMQEETSLVTFAVADAVLRMCRDISGLGDLGDPAGLPWVALVLGALGLATVPVTNAFSRRLEYQADAFALRATGAPAPLVDALERLGTLNLADRRPPRLEELLLYSHPALDRRIEALRKTLPRMEGPEASTE
jgi:STE24 endopeptidase